MSHDLDKLFKPHYPDRPAGATYIVPVPDVLANGGTKKQWEAAGYNVDPFFPRTFVAKPGRGGSKRRNRRARRGVK